MSEAPDGDREPGGYLRLPLPVVGIGLFAFLAVLLGVGLYANANWRSPGVIIPTAAPVAAATPALATQVPAVTTPQVATPTAVRSAPTATSPPQPTVAPTQVGTAALVQVGGQTVTPTAVSATAPETPTPLPTVEPTLAAEVGQAYENYWRVRSQALLDLDASHLSEVMDGDYLTTFEASLERAAHEGHAIRTQVTLNYMVLEVVDDSAVVHDRIEDNSYYVVPGTVEPLSDPANDLLRLEFTMRSIGGVWKVVDSVSAD